MPDLRQQWQQSQKIAGNDGNELGNNNFKIRCCGKCPYIKDKKRTDNNGNNYLLILVKSSI